MPPDVPEYYPRDPMDDASEYVAVQARLLQLAEQRPLARRPALVIMFVAAIITLAGVILAVAYLRSDEGPGAAYATFAVSLTANVISAYSIRERRRATRYSHAVLVALNDSDLRLGPNAEPLLTRLRDNLLELEEYKSAAVLDRLVARGPRG